MWQPWYISSLSYPSYIMTVRIIGNFKFKRADCLISLKYNLIPLRERKRKHHLALLYRISRINFYIDDKRPEIILKNRNEIKFKTPVTKLTMVLKSPFFRRARFLDMCSYERKINQNSGVTQRSKTSQIKRQKTYPYTFTRVFLYGCTSGHTSGAMNTDMSAFMGLSPNKDLKNDLIRAESVFLASYMIYIMLLRHWHVSASGLCQCLWHHQGHWHVNIHGA